MLTHKQLASLENLRTLAREELVKIQHTPGIFHDEDFRLLSNVPGWIDHVKKYHDNPFGKSGVEGCLENLRNVVGRFKFKL